MLMRVLSAAIFLLLSVTAAHAQPVRLSLNNAIRSALEDNARVRISAEDQIQAQARAREQRSQVLPNFNGLVNHTNQSINLHARGLDFPIVPEIVGPFGTTDARIRFGEILDMSLIRRYQSAKRSSDASVFETEGLRNEVAAMTARLYFDVLRSSAMIESIRAQIELDESLLKLAQDRLDVGAGTKLDVTRAQSRLSADQYRLLQAQNESRTAGFRLLRAMGQPLDQDIELTDTLASSNLIVPPADEAVRIAFQNRAEIKTEDKRLEAARLTFGAARAELWPWLEAFGDYGTSGTGGVLLPTRLIGVQLNVPIFDSGRRSAHRESAGSQLRQAEIRARDTRDEIEMEVRVAVDNIASAREQLRSAEESLRLAQEELELSRLRFEAQVSTQIDVINAQVELSVARARQVNALFGLRSAELEYQRAAGLDIQ